MVLTFLCRGEQGGSRRGETEGDRPLIPNCLTESLIYLALVRGPHESNQGAQLGGMAAEGRESVRKETRRGRNGEWAQGWLRLAAALSYQAPPLAARALA